MGETTAGERGRLGDRGRGSEEKEKKRAIVFLDVVGGERERGGRGGGGGGRGASLSDDGQAKETRKEKPIVDVAFTNKTFPEEEEEEKEIWKREGLLYPRLS